MCSTSSILANPVSDPSLSHSAAGPTRELICSWSHHNVGSRSISIFEIWFARICDTVTVPMPLHRQHSETQPLLWVVVSHTGAVSHLPTSECPLTSIWYQQYLLFYDSTSWLHETISFNYDFWKLTFFSMGSAGFTPRTYIAWPLPQKSRAVFQLALARLARRGYELYSHSV